MRNRHLIVIGFAVLVVLLLWAAGGVDFQASAETDTALGGDSAYPPGHAHLSQPPGWGDPHHQMNDVRQLPHPLHRHGRPGKCREGLQSIGWDWIDNPPSESDVA
jgi:hypothetical protein